MSIPDRDDFATAPGDAAQDGSLQDLLRVRSEMEIVGRVLASLRVAQQLDLQPFVAKYFERLEEILRFAESQQSSLRQYSGKIAANLAFARSQFLDDVPSAHQWARIARAIDPTAQLILPKRFYGPPVRLPEIDSEKLAEEMAAAAWARSVTS